ncbi:13229_t:CDS:2 [Entrophospora sp. SA101]|nr:13229_t:CDS:2 [Entrophospora sp. SA101]
MPVLSELAAKLMSIPALLAAAERNWSHFGFVHRLPDDRVKQMPSLEALKEVGPKREKIAKTFGLFQQTNLKI